MTQSTSHYYNSLVPRLSANQEPGYEAMCTRLQGMLLLYKTKGMVTITRNFESWSLCFAHTNKLVTFPGMATKCWTRQCIYWTSQATSLGLRHNYHLNLELRDVLILFAASCTVALDLRSHLRASKLPKLFERHALPEGGGAHWSGRGTQIHPSHRRFRLCCIFPISNQLTHSSAQRLG